MFNESPSKGGEYIGDANWTDERWIKNSKPMHKGGEGFSNDIDFFQSKDKYFNDKEYFKGKDHKDAHKDFKGGKGLFAFDDYKGGKNDFIFDDLKGNYGGKDNKGFDKDVGGKKKGTRRDR